MTLRGPVNVACASFLLVLLGSSAVARASDLEEAMQYYDRGDYVHAAQRFHAAAVTGDARAQEVLGLMYALGGEVYPGVPHDPRAAARWFDVAARNGRHVSRYVACAMLRGAMHQVRSLNCFDWVEGFGRPGPH